MRVIIAGGRKFNNYSLLCEKLDYYFSNIEDKHSITIICGEAQGADTLGKRYAQDNNLKVISFPANWNTHGVRAGYIRNEEMANNSDALVAFWDGYSRGTSHMIKTMQKLGKPVKIVFY